MHEGFNIEHVWDVVLEELLEVLTSWWQIFIHHDFNEKAEILVPVEANPSETVIKNKS